MIDTVYISPLVRMANNVHFPGLEWIVDANLAEIIPSHESRDGLARHIFIHITNCECQSHCDTIVLVEAMLHDNVTMHDIITSLYRINFTPKCKYHRRFVGLRQSQSRQFHYEAVFKYGGSSGFDAYVVIILLLLFFFAYHCVAIGAVAISG